MRLESTRLSQSSISPRVDLREMLRHHIISRSLRCMEVAHERREEALARGTLEEYRKGILASVSEFYGCCSRLPIASAAPKPDVRRVSSFEHDGFRVENVLFESYPGWQVNATVFLPTEGRPPYPAVVVGVGHSGKQFDSYQLPCQYFARCGLVAICFDPPEQAGEKQPGNDHFTDGVRDYLLGETSSRYFVVDALRCIDYLETRRDVDMSRGVAMTGVSGGGTTTIFAACLDPRVTVIGPSCCVTPLAYLDINQCYAGCPETHQYGRYALGIDEVDLLCAISPTPCLLMAGNEDEVFHIGDTTALADIVRRFYEASGCPEAFGFYVDEGGHNYSLAQAREFALFAARRLSPNKPLLSVDPASVRPLPREELMCHPATDVNMRSRSVLEAAAHAAQWDKKASVIRSAVMKTAGMGERVAVDAEVGDAFQVWCHDWHSAALYPEEGIELPATLLLARPVDRENLAPILFHIDDNGRHRLLHRGGPLATAIGFADMEHTRLSLFSADLRGWGDSSPAMYPYEMAGWGSIDRYLAYSTAALGDSVTAMRIRDAVACLTWLRCAFKPAKLRIIVTASGCASMIALHAAVIDGGVSGVVTWDGLSSYSSLIGAESYPWPADTFLPGVLRHYDLPELASVLDCPLRLLGLRDGTGALALENSDEAAKYSGLRHVSLTGTATNTDIIGNIRALLD